MSQNADSPHIHIAKDGFFARTVAFSQLDSSKETVIEMARYGSLQVSVRETNGAPVTDVYVYAQLSRPQNDEINLANDLPTLVRPGYMAWYKQRGLAVPSGNYIESGTDVNGTVRLDHLPCGVELIVRAEGKVVPQQARITIDPLSGRASLVFEGELGSVVRGRIAQADGSSLPHALLVRLDPVSTPVQDRKP